MNLVQKRVFLERIRPKQTEQNVAIFSVIK
jgi:hypothetical protein